MKNAFSTFFGKKYVKMATIFFAKFPVEQTPQLFLLSDHTNRKNTNKKYSRPWQVLPFVMAFSASGSQTTGDSTPSGKYWAMYIRIDRQTPKKFRESFLTYAIICLSTLRLCNVLVCVLSLCGLRIISFVICAACLKCR